VPCAYNWGVASYYRTHWGGFPSRPYYRDAFFEKRLTWIANCAQIANFTLYHFAYRKGNVSRYFVYVHSIFIPKEYFGKWYLESVELAHHICYYLGTFPNYWNTTNKKIVFAHDLMTASVYPMENEPVFYNEDSLKQSIAAREKMNIQGIPTKDLISEEEKSDIESLEGDFGLNNLMNYLYPERMDQSAKPAFFAQYPSGPGTDIDEAITKMAYFHKKSEILEWLRQKYALAEQKQSFDECIDKYYPKAKKPQYKIRDPQGIKNFPGIPIEQMQLPAPTARSVPRPPPEKTIIKLMFSFRVIIWSSLNGYQLILNLEEVKG
jgi:hypothetical protein